MVYPICLSNIQAIKLCMLNHVIKRCNTNSKLLKYGFYMPIPTYIYINHIILIFHEMAEYNKYFKVFSRREKKHFRRVLPHQNTVCKVIVCLKSTSQSKKFQSISVSSNKGHAEILALLNITNGLIKYLHQTNISHGKKEIEITECDLVLRLNNSPCHLSGCQSFIQYWIEHIMLGLIPQVPFYFSLLFSNFYDEKGINKIDNLKDWALELVNLGITVYFCPIIVSQAFTFSRSKVRSVIKSDQELKANYLFLLKKFQENHELTISCSDGFQSESEISLKTFASELQYICISLQS